MTLILMETDIKKLRQQLSDYLDIREFLLEPIPYGASVRRYYRLQFQEAGYFPEDTVVLMQTPLERLEIEEDYFKISSYLTHRGINPPRVFEFQRKYGWIFMEVARGTRLDEFFRNNSEYPKDIVYKQLLNFLMNLQQTARYESRCPAFHRKFDKEKFQYEFNFHVKEQLLQNYFNHQFSPAELEQFNQFSQDISGYLNLDLPVFVHRDFQSSNIFYHPGNESSHFQIIDFQDARSGHPLYDLVSLLWDSYVDLPEELVNMFIKYFYANSPIIREQFSDIDYEKHIDYLIIQRKLHDAGAFAYTFFLTQNNYYIQYIKTAISMALTKILKYNYWPKISGIFQKILETEYV